MVVRLRLYVTGDPPNSLAARRALARILDEMTVGSVEVEIIDLLTQPERGSSDGILVTPTLVRVDRSPARYLIGNLSDEGRVYAMLELEQAP